MNKITKEKLRKLTKYYNSLDYDADIKGTAGESDHQKKVDLLERLFFDKLRPLSANEIFEILSVAEEPLVAPTMGFLPSPAEYVAFKIYEAKMLIQQASDSNKIVLSPPCRVFTTNSGDPKVKQEILGDRILSDTPIYKSLTNEKGISMIVDGKEIMLAMINSDITSPILRGSDTLTSYLNYIPNIERSKCVPYLNVSFVSTSDSSKTEPIAVLKFLGSDYDSFNNKKELKAGTADYMLSAASKRPAGNFLPDGGTVHSMELFTMPQSLRAKTSDLGDPFRPLLSLNGIDINIVSGGDGLIAWKTAILSMTLFDRTKLKDISFLLDPGRFGETVIEVEAGWTHPDRNSAYGNVLNEMKIKDTYRITKSDFSLRGGSTFDITLDMSSQIGGDLHSKAVFASNANSVRPGELFKDVTAILKKYKDAAAKINGEGIGSTAVIPSYILDDEQTGLTIKIDGAKIKSLKKALTDIKKLDETPARTAKLAEISTLVKEIEDSASTIESYNKTLTANIDDFKSKMATQIELDLFLNTLEDVAERGVIDKSKYISFGAMFLNLVAFPFVSSHDSITGEVHVMTYNFNKYAGELGYGSAAGTGNRNNIASFALVKEDVIAAMTELLQEKGNISMNDFISYARGKMKDKSDFQIGLLKTKDGKSTQDATEKDAQDKKEAEIELTGLKKKKEAEGDEAEKATIATEITKKEAEIEALRVKIDKAGADGETALLARMGTSKLRMPQLQVHIESVSYEKVSTTGVKSKNNIIRFHLYDKNEKPYEYQEIASKMIDKLTVPPGGESSDIDDLPGYKCLNKLKLIGAIEPVKKASSSKDKNTEYRVVGRHSEVKKTIKETMPSITYGTEATAINSVSISSISDSDIETVFHMRAQENKKAAADKPAETESKNPGESNAKKIMPITLDINMLGCPILEYGQQIFLDFGTMTDLDNVYGVMGVTHSLKPGSFTTNVKLSPTFSGELTSFSDIVKDMSSVHGRFAELMAATSDNDDVNSALDAITGVGG